MKPDLKFKIDENLPVEIAECISHLDYDAMTVIAQKLKGSSDLDIADICRKEG